MLFPLENICRRIDLGVSYVTFGDRHQSSNQKITNLSLLNERYHFQDMKESMFTETEPAQALREIRTRYPAFDMVAFMRLLKGDVPLVIKAYLNGDLEALREHCSKEMMERFSGIIAAQKAEVG